MLLLEFELVCLLLLELFLLLDYVVNFEFGSFAREPERLRFELFEFHVNNLVDFRDVILLLFEFCPTCLLTFIKLLFEFAEC